MGIMAFRSGQLDLDIIRRIFVVSAFSVFAILLVGQLFVQPATAVPDARLTVETVSISPSNPIPGETFTIAVTVSNSAGSTSAANIKEVYLKYNGRKRAKASNIGSLSVGDTVTVPLTYRFGKSGYKDTTVHVVARENDGNKIEIKRPVPLTINDSTTSPLELPYRGDIELSASIIPRSEVLQSFQQGLGGASAGGGAAASTDISQFIGTSVQTETQVEDVEDLPFTLSEYPVEVTVSNLGTGTLRDAVLVADIENHSTQRIIVEDVDPRSSREVYLDTAGFNNETDIDFSLRFDSKGGSGVKNQSLRYQPRMGIVEITDIDMVRENGRTVIRGSASNIGLSDVNSVLVRVMDTGNVQPSYPQKDYFVGTVPGSDFATFELAANVSQDTNFIPLMVSYKSDTIPYREVFRVDYNPRQTDDGGDSSSTPIYIWAILAMVVVAAGYIANRYLR